jgi:hypothetical protein
MRRRSRRACVELNVILLPATAVVIVFIVFACKLSAHCIVYCTFCSKCSVLTSPFPEFESAFNDMWANNADALSLLYSGTDAMKTDFTRLGKRTLMGAINDGVNGAKRWIFNNLDDGRTQDAWDLFLGRFVPGKHDARDAGNKGSGGKRAALQRHLQSTTSVSYCLACVRFGACWSQ